MPAMGRLRFRAKKKREGDTEVRRENEGGPYMSIISEAVPEVF